MVSRICEIGMTSLKKVLVIDDDPSSLKLIKKLMENEGFATFPFTTWKSDTISNIISISPDVIILDEYLVGVRGSDLCTILKSINELRTTPVILISGIQNLEKVAEGCKANGYVQKPLSLGDIEGIVNLVSKAA
ncbi:response regulator [Desertivirga brevis]|uniref:response regulator n=1 Tax=Desertivirga brevis TaxID=2810310 RepID=UPI001A97AE0A|nr:response regulator [Pedobacter sp. SYSU D00873]